MCVNFGFVVYTVLYSTTLYERNFSISEYNLKKSWPSKGKVEFKNLSLRYIENDPPVLKKLNFTIHQGEKVPDTLVFHLLLLLIRLFLDWNCWTYGCRKIFFNFGFIPTFLLGWIDSYRWSGHEVCWTDGFEEENFHNSSGTGIIFGISTI